MENSKIEWTDHTFNPWSGCIKVSPGCQHCYAETLSNRWGKEVWGPGPKRQRTSESYWKNPLKWNKQAAKERRRFRVFCASMADVFEDNPQLEPWRIDLLDLIQDTPRLDWLLLTKRPENVNRMIERATGFSESGMWFHSAPHVQIGTSIENQEYADERIPELLNIPARVRFLSIEPLLGPVDLEDLAYEAAGPEWAGFNPLVDWVIVGGESGPGARPMHPEWARSLRDQCQGAGVPFFFKQWGEFAPCTCDDPGTGCLRIWPDGTHTKVDEWEPGPHLKGSQGMHKVGKKVAGRILDGRTWDEFPKRVLEQITKGVSYG